MKNNELFKQSLEEVMGNKNDIKNGALYGASNQEPQNTGYRNFYSEVGSGGNDGGNGGKKPKRLSKVIFASIAASLVLFGLIALALYLPTLSPNAPGDDLKPFAMANGVKRANSYAEIDAALANYETLRNASFYSPTYNSIGNILGGSLQLDSATSGSGESKSAQPPTAMPGGAVESPQEVSDGVVADDDSSTSKTNVQTEGLDEGDIVKWDSNYIYKLSKNGFYIIKAANGILTVETKIELENYVPQEMYISGSKVVLIGGIYEEIKYTGSIYGYYPSPAIGLAVEECYSYLAYSKMDIRIYDVEDKANAVLERQITLDGNFVSSRLIEKDNTLVFAGYYYVYQGGKYLYPQRTRGNANSEEWTTSVPTYKDSGENMTEFDKIPSHNIFYYEDIPNCAYMLVGSISLDNPQGKATLYAFLGLDGEMYMSENNIYFTTYDSGYEYKKDENGKLYYVYGTPKTRVTRISLDAASYLLPAAQVKVEGSIEDRYHLDEYNGYLRIATSLGYYQDNQISVYSATDSKFELIGQSERFGAGEQIHSVRFNKNECTVVTFRNTDPMFLYDLTDPKNIKLISEYEEEGVTEFIKYIGDTEFKIGIGTINGGIKVALYDSKGKATEILIADIMHSAIGLPPTDNYYENSYTDIFYNKKAFYYDEERQLFGFAFEFYQSAYYYNGSQYFSYQSNYQGFALFSWAIYEESNEIRLTSLGALTELGVAVYGYGDEYYYNDRDNFYNRYQYNISRGFRIGDYIYTVSDAAASSYKITDLLSAQSIITNYAKFSTVKLDDAIEFPVWLGIEG
ncbi:MAG: beta-propeller domain-containing protein [Christensenellaceae bacterium]|jgi:uncharacterized secreted protein with C-terminal beta-propeller domain|nr:beta-propeller domain-containing protein [Christensenellaceae bacterium]